MDKGQRVGVLMGGLSVERVVSQKTGAAVLAALLARGWDAVGVDAGHDLPGRLIAEGVDVAWLALHGRFGEDGCVQGLLEVMGIPYTGSGVLASAIAMDKGATKRALASDRRVTMAADLLLRAGDDVPASAPIPAVVKPVGGGSTLGMTLARDRAALVAAVAEALVFDDEVLVESYVEGEEITVAVLDGEALPVIRILPEGGFFDFEAKYTKGKTVYEVPAKISPETTSLASEAAVAAYRVLGCRGVARADFIVRADGVPVFLEINTLPGMTATSLVPMAAEAAGLSFATVCERVLCGARCHTPRGA